MLAAIALMYSKQALGLAFHEIGGLALIGVFFIHKGLNFSWIVRVTQKLRTANGRIRLMWLVDALMLVAFLLVGISGILISKIAFPGLAVQGGSWKSIHYSCAALALILVGVHLGLHANYLMGTLFRRIRWNRAVAIALSAVILVYGVYGIASTSFTRWLVMPFSSGAQGGGQHGERNGQFPGSSEDAEAETTGEAQTAADDSAAVSASDESTGSSQGNGQGNGLVGGDRGGQSGSFAGALGTFAQFFSITFVFAALTALLDRLLGRKKRHTAV